MTRLHRSLLLRLALPWLVLLLIFAFSKYSIAASTGQTHRGDTGLGLALLLGFSCLGLLTGYTVDGLTQLSRGNKHLLFADLCVILILLIPFGWVGCNWFGITAHPVCWAPLHLFDGVIKSLKI